MIKSWCSNENPKAEWDDIKKPAHVAKIRAAIDKNFVHYFDSLVHPAEAPAQGTDLLARLGEKYKVTASSKPATASKAKADASALVKAIADHDKRASQYRSVFEPEVLEEYRDDDPDAFKTHLTRQCPVIRIIVNSKSTELKDWRSAYKRCAPEKLLTVFENLLAFAVEYLGGPGVEKTYATLKTADELAVDDFDTEELSITGVIGSGIKSLALYHLYPRVFPALGGRSVFALYFLTEKGTFNLRSKTSEFLIVNDAKNGKDINITMDHNYWYPYSLFTEYAVQVSALIQAACAARGIDFDFESRYVYADAFFKHVCDVHAADLKVMGGIDELRWASK